MDFGPTHQSSDYAREQNTHKEREKRHLCGGENINYIYNSLRYNVTPSLLCRCKKEEMMNPRAEFSRPGQERGGTPERGGARGRARAQQSGGREKGKGQVNRGTASIYERRGWGLFKDGVQSSYSQQCTIWIREGKQKSKTQYTLISAQSRNCCQHHIYIKWQQLLFLPQGSPPTYPGA